MVLPHELPTLLSLERLGVAVILGFTIGLERQWRQRTAGLHTMTLVAVGAALFSMLPALLGLTTDLTRIAANVVTGIGFLAGAAILREGLNVRGLATAATMWATAAVGVLVGNGFYIEAAVATIVIVGVNYFLAFLVAAVDERMRSHFTSMNTTYTVHVSCEERARSAIRLRFMEATKHSRVTIRSLKSTRPTDGATQIDFELVKGGHDDDSIERIARALASTPGVDTVSWEAVEEAL
jgi:putative Mg2+ transporter-C (MgtC) family protein